MRRELAEVDRLRSALLAAVGHDLRTPLAAIKAAVTHPAPARGARSMRRTGNELLATIEALAPTGSPTWSRTCSTFAACRPARSASTCVRCRSTRSSPAPCSSDTS